MALGSLIFELGPYTLSRHHVFQRAVHMNRLHLGLHQGYPRWGDCKAMELQLIRIMVKKPTKWGIQIVKNVKHLIFHLKFIQIAEPSWNLPFVLAKLQKCLFGATYKRIISGQFPAFSLV